jgi:hypothetical protein
MPPSPNAPIRHENRSDAAVQARLRAELGFAMLFISHDLSVAGAHEIRHMRRFQAC